MGCAAFAANISKEMKGDRWKMAVSGSTKRSPVDHVVYYVEHEGMHGQWRRTVLAESTDEESRLMIATEALCLAS